jgi:cephalosporin hydroxylase
MSTDPDDSARSDSAPHPVERDVNALLEELRALIDTDRSKAREAISTLVRLQTAEGLAAEFLKRKRPYERNAFLADLLQAQLLDKLAFLQKPPYLLQFYRRLLFAMESAPTSVLEIGVKGGGSTAFWKVLFPEATVVGMDIKLQHTLTSQKPTDGVIYVEGDQSDIPTLERIAGEFGPFSIVIDDGSHVSDHQATTLRCLLPHMRPGGFYVVEDVHANLKSTGEQHKRGYGEDIWPDFILTWFERLRGGPTSSDTAGGRLAFDVSGKTDDLIIGKRAIALRVEVR